MPAMPTEPSSSLSSIRHGISTIFKILLIISAAFAAWHSLCFVTASKSPIIVVISESMEPAFYRGDVLFVWNRTEVFEVGEIAVCWFEGRPLPMVHRIIQRMPEYEAGKNESTISKIENPKYQYLTKGDNNQEVDTPLYPPGQPFVKRHQIIGKIKGYVPYVGWVTILMSERPWIKTAIFGAVGVSSLLQKRKPATPKA